MRYLLLLAMLSCSGKHNMTGPPDNPRPPTKCKHHHNHHNHDHDDNDRNKMEKQR